MQMIDKHADKHMTYEEYLDEVTTLMTEKFDISAKAAIKLVMRAQEAEYFSAHDDDASIRTLERADQDAITVFNTRGLRNLPPVE